MTEARLNKLRANSWSDSNKWQRNWTIFSLFQNHLRLFVNEMSVSSRRLLYLRGFIVVTSYVDVVKIQISMVSTLHIIQISHEMKRGNVIFSSSGYLVNSLNKIVYLRFGAVEMVMITSIAFRVRNIFLANLCKLYYNIVKSEPRWILLPGAFRVWELRKDCLLLVGWQLVKGLNVQQRPAWLDNFEVNSSTTTQPSTRTPPTLHFSFRHAKSSQKWGQYIIREKNDHNQCQCLKL